MRAIIAGDSGCRATNPIDLHRDTGAVCYIVDQDQSTRACSLSIGSNGRMVPITTFLEI
jgi:hypothetical protein